MSERDRERRGAARKVGWARLVARARQVLTTDASAARDDDEQVVDDAGAAELARQAGALRGGVAKVAQLSAYQATEDPTAASGRAELASLWDRVPPMSGEAIAAVVAAELGAPPGQMFARWDLVPLASASLGQVHAAEDDGVDGGAPRRWAVKVQYPAIAEALRSDLASRRFARQLAGAEIGGALDDTAVAALQVAIADELDYRREADGLRRFAAHWQDDPVIAIPAVDPARSTSRVLTMQRAAGVALARWAGEPAVRDVIGTALARFAWGSPLRHGVFNTDPHPGNFLVEESAGQGPRLWCLDFGGWCELEPEAAAADRELWWGLIDEDPFAGAERFRMGLARAGLLRRTDRLATAAHRDWERLLALPLRRGSFAWTTAYADELAGQFRRVMLAGGVTLPAPVAMLWRQRLGVAAVLGRLGARFDGGRLVRELIGTGKHALR
jgi:predicted unusual protein kinase regulating ubiquinone biosynthesis (AarF/ABC1/UbiB family)